MLHIYTALQIGEYHINHCEDYLFVGDIGNDKKICAVMDGCTMAPDSYFASTLVGKILKKIVKERDYKTLYQPESDLSLDAYLKSILKDVFTEINIIRNRLLLDKKELFTTLTLLLADIKTNTAIAFVIGDGLVSINGKIYDFDQDNKPDYLGFHLDDPFDAWYDAQTQKLNIENIEDVAIATDGIFTFTPVKMAEINDPIQPITFLLNDHSKMEHEDMLYLKLKKLENAYGLKPTDDLAIIRLRFT